MYLALWIFFAVFLLAGIFFNLVLYHKDKHKEKESKFITSKQLLVFIVDIVIAVIGFGLTLSVTNANEREIEKEKAIQMLTQTIQYTDWQIADERSYLKMHSRGEIDDRKLFNSNVISLTYYENILSNEVILQNANMNTYGDIMRYLLWIENSNTRAQTALAKAEAAPEQTEQEAQAAEDGTQKKDTTEVYNQMYWRCAYLRKARDLLSVCCDELSGDMTTQEAAEMRKQIADLPLSGYECITK